MAMLRNRKKVQFEEYSELDLRGRLANMLWEHIAYTGTSDMKILIPDEAICMGNVESDTIKRGAKQTVSGIDR